MVVCVQIIMLNEKKRENKRKEAKQVEGLKIRKEENIGSADVCMTIRWFCCFFLFPFSLLNIPPPLHLVRFFSDKRQRRKKQLT